MCLKMKSITFISFDREASLLYVRIYVPSTLAHETRSHENKNWPVGVVFLPTILEVEIPSDLQLKTHRTLGDLARSVSGQSVVLITPRS